MLFVLSRILACGVCETLAKREREREREHSPDHPGKCAAAVAEWRVGQSQSCSGSGIAQLLPTKKCVISTQDLRWLFSCFGGCHGALLKMHGLRLAGKVNCEFSWGHNSAVWKFWWWYLADLCLRIWSPLRLSPNWGESSATSSVKIQCLRAWWSAILHGHGQLQTSCGRISFQTRTCWNTVKCLERLSCVDFKMYNLSDFITIKLVLGLAIELKMIERFLHPHQSLPRPHVWNKLDRVT